MAVLQLGGALRVAIGVQERFGHHVIQDFGEILALHPDLPPEQRPGLSG